MSTAEKRIINTLIDAMLAVTTLPSNGALGEIREELMVSLAKDLERFGNVIKEDSMASHEKVDTL